MNPRVLQLAGAVFIGLVLVVGLIAVGRSGEENSPAAPVSETAALFAGIPQDGIALGEPEAPVTIVEYADLQCPFCGEWDRNVLPTVVENYVRGGRVRIELRTMAFLGPDSVRAAHAASQAAGQDRLWHFVDRFYRSQGPENSGYVTEDFLRRIAGEVDRLDVDRTLEISGAGDMAINEAQSRADRAGISSTPSFTVGPTGGKQTVMALESLEPAEFTALLDKELARK